MSAPLYYLQDPADGLFVRVPYASTLIEWTETPHLATPCTRSQWVGWIVRMRLECIAKDWVYVRADGTSETPYHTDLVRLLGVNGASRINREPKVNTRSLTPRKSSRLAPGTTSAETPKHNRHSQRSQTPMPEATAVVTAPTPVVTAAEIPRLVKGSLVRDKGKLILRLDCSGLHAYLDSLGVERDRGYRRFNNAPGGRADVIDTSEHALVPKALCSWQLDPTTNVDTSILTFDLMRHYSTPPNLEAMNRIAESVPEAALAVVAHYQPVEISISVVGKKPAK